MQPIREQAVISILQWVEIAAIVGNNFVLQYIGSYQWLIAYMHGKRQDRY